MSYSLNCSLEQNTLIVEPSIPLKEAINLMAKAHLRSLVVRHENDVACFLFKSLHPNDTVQTAIDRIANTPIGSVPRVRKGAVADDSIHLDTVIKYFEYSPRIIIVKDGRILRVLSAIDVVAVLKFSGKLAELAAMEPVSFQQCAHVRSPIAVAINEDCTLYKALETLTKTGFSALPIVMSDAPDKPVAVFSVRDLIPLFTSTSALSTNALQEPTMDLVAALRQRQSGAARFPFMHVPATSSLQTAVDKIVATGVHRVLLADAQGHISGVVSVTDVIRVIARVLEEYGKA